MAILELQRVRDWANDLHGGQTYDDGPYSDHLDMVVQAAYEFMYLLYSPDEKDEILTVLSACRCHDTLEDTTISYNDLVREIGHSAADIVYAVTDELGKNRMERALKTYPKIADNRLAVFVKLCDRIANVRRAVERRSRFWKMYEDQYPVMEYALYRKNEYEPMWYELKKLLNIK